MIDMPHPGAQKEPPGPSPANQPPLTSGDATHSIMLLAPLNTHARLPATVASWAPKREAAKRCCSSRAVSPEFGTGR